MPDTESNSEERLKKIETQMAHLEHLFDQLNQAVIEQGKSIRRIQVQQQRVGATIEALELERIKSTNQKPPHY